MFRIKQLPDDFIVEEIIDLNLKSHGPYQYFSMVKSNINTHKIIEDLAVYNKIKSKNIGYAGIKDKNAITKQYISIRTKSKVQIPNYVNLVFVGYGEQPISLGSHTHNKFIITVRNILKKPKKTDFLINYFDEQRFGHRTLEIGMAILNKNFKAAADLIKTRPSKDYIGLIKQQPFKIQKLYIHSVQSLLWNQAACQHVKLKTKNFINIKYKHGTFVFPLHKIQNINIPLISFDSNIDSVYKEILKQNHLTLNDFVLRSMPELTPQGGLRELVTEVIDLKIGTLENDNLNPNKKTIQLQFKLKKGVYATLLIKKIFKN